MSRSRPLPRPLELIARAIPLTYAGRWEWTGVLEDPVDEDHGSTLRRLGCFAAILLPACLAGLFAESAAPHDRMETLSFY